MSVSAEYIGYIQDLLEEMPNITTRNFFGGVALRSGLSGKDTQFAMIINDILYFVVDDLSRPKYEEKGMQAFQYEKKTGTVKVRKYYTAPEELFENKEKMIIWAREALETANRLK